MKRMGILFTLIVLLFSPVGPATAQEPVPPMAALAGPAGLVPTAGLPLAHWPGPDGYGYRGTSAPYTWVDIRTTGTRIAITGDDQCSGALPIGFSFPFYGAVYTTFYAQTNGTLSFTPTTDFSNDCLLPDARAPDNVIALAWDDLYMDRAAWARYQTFPTCPAGPATACLVVTFANMDTIAGQTAGTWQALLYPSGEVRLQYQDTGQAAGASSTTGIEGANFLANHGLTYACEVAGSLAPSTTVRFYAPPLLLLPEEAAYDACRLEWQDHHLEAVNRTLLSATLTLTYTVAGPAEVSGPATLGPLAAGESRPFTLSVRLTEAAGLSTTVVVTVIARAQETGVTATAQIAQRAAAAHLDDRWQAQPAGAGLYWGASYYDPGSDAVCFVDGLTGQSPNVVVANIHTCYDPAAGSWSTRAPAPVPVFAPAYGWIDGRFYLAGGFTTTAFTATRQVQVYDPAADAWSWGALMPTARGGAAGGVVNGQLIAAGGSSTGIYPLDCPTYAYDPALNTWTSRAACPLQGGYGLFLGGGVGSDTASRLFAGGHFDAHYGWYAYDPAANTWAARAGLPGLVHRTPLFVERDGDVYMVGGLTGWTPAARVYHYDPAADAWDALPPMLHTPTGGSLGPAHGSFGSPAYGGFWSYGGTAGSGALLPAPHEWWGWVVCEPCVGTTVEAWKTAPPSAALGQVISYTVVVSVSGPLDYTWLADPLPAGVTYAGGLTWTAGQSWYSAADDTVYWQGDSSLVGTIEAFSLITVTFDVTVTAACPAVISNVGAADCGEEAGRPFTATTAVTGPLPQPSFDYAVASCTATFTNTSLYGEAFLWAFGDGATSTETNPLHSYGQDGTYTVTLAVANDCGADAYTMTVVVGNCCEPVTWADFTWAPPTPTAGLPATFTGTVTGTLPMSYTWAWGDGTVSTGTCPLPLVPCPLVSHTYTLPGRYTVTLTATNPCTIQPVVAAYTLTVVPPCYPAEVLSVTAVVSHCAVTFGAELTGTAPFAYLWAFGDGATSTETNPLHSYAQDGTYTVTLEVANGCGSDAYTLTVGVDDCCEPVTWADFTWAPPTPTAGLPVTLTGTATGTLPITYRWMLEVGSWKEGEVVTYTYDMPGTYTVTLTATNPCTDPPVAVTHTVAVAPPCVPAEILSYTAGISGCVVAFGAEVTGTAPIAWHWDFGAFGSSTETNPVADFGADGTYPVTLTVSNCEGTGQDQAAFTVTVHCAPPCDPPAGAAFTWSPPLPAVGEVVRFTATVSGGTPPFTCTWAFGDGAAGSGANATHAYALSGEYPVRLTVTNGCGAAAVTHVLAVVEPCAPPAGAAFTWFPPTPAVGEAVHLTATVTGGTPPLAYTWDFGDGQVADWLAPPSRFGRGAGGVGLAAGPAAGAAVTHTYPLPGLYTVTLTATNGCGLDTASAPVHVVEGPIPYLVYLPLVAKDSLGPRYGFHAARSTQHASLLTSHALPDAYRAAVPSLPALPLSRGDPVHIQEATNGAALKGTWVMVDYEGDSPSVDILLKVNATAEDYGVPDTNGVPDDVINDNILAYYVYFDGSCVPLDYECWELHAGPDVIPAGSKGLRVEVTLPITSAAVDLAGTTAAVTATATAVYVLDGGILPIAVNEYWRGSQEHCPYANCGEPYSFVRNPSEPPPFSSTDGGLTWARNFCPNPYNEDTCQGPYEGYGENFGQAFALLGADAKPNYGSIYPRGAVMLDSRYDALADGGHWYLLVDDDIWEGPDTLAPIADGQGADLMAEVIRQGGYTRLPIPRSLQEPAIPYIQDWGYCWDTPSEYNCFNYPASGRSAPFDGLQLLSGAKSAFLAEGMYDDGNYVDGRYAPGERIVVMVYNGAVGSYWGTGSHRSDVAPVVGYVGVIIVGYGSSFDSPCYGTPGDWTSYVPCISGNPNTLYGIASFDGPLMIDPSQLLNEWLPKRVVLITPTVDLPVVVSGPAQSNLVPYPPHRPAPFDMAVGVPLTTTLSWRGVDPDDDSITYTVAFGPSDPPPVVATGLLTPTYDPGPLLTDMTYYWAITATDGLSTTVGPRWQFSTAEPVVEEYYIYLPLVVRG